MSKRNISYIKPQDPSFLAKLKAEIGYKEGPTVDTKRQRLEEAGDSDSSDGHRELREDEKPQIVVIQSGDLTAQEVAREEERIAREQAEAPADLSKPVVFQKRKSKDSSEVKPNEKVKQQKASKSKQKSKEVKSKLSFNHEDEDEDQLED